MSFRYWLRLLTSLTLQLLALGIALHLVFGAWSLYEANRDAYRKYQNVTKSEQDKAADDIAAGCSVVAQNNPALRDCLRESVSAYQKKNNTNQDLEAQKEMAFWAFITAIVSSIGLFISIGGLYLVFQSLRQTRQAISNDRTIGEAQVRAYLSVESPEQHFVGNIRPGKTFIGQLRIKNTGQSPAYDVRYIAALMLLDYPLPDNQGDLVEPDPASIQRGVTIGAGADTRIEAGLVNPLTAEEIKYVGTEGDIRLYAVAIVTYFDVFKRREQKTKYCAYLTAGVNFINDNGVVATKHEWALANVHNEAT